MLWQALQAAICLYTCLICGIRWSYDMSFHMLFHVWLDIFYVLYHFLVPLKCHPKLEWWYHIYDIRCSILPLQWYVFKRSSVISRGHQWFSILDNIFVSSGLCHVSIFVISQPSILILSMLALAPQSVYDFMYEIRNSWQIAV